MAEAKQLNSERKFINNKKKNQEQKKIMSEAIRNNLSQ